MSTATIFLLTETFLRMMVVDTSTLATFPDLSSRFAPITKHGRGRRSLNGNLWWNGNIHGIGHVSRRFREYRFYAKLRSSNDNGIRKPRVRRRLSSIPATDQGFPPGVIFRVVTNDEDDHMSELSDQEQNKNQGEPELVVPQDVDIIGEPTDLDVRRGRGSGMYACAGTTWFREVLLPPYKRRYARARNNAEKRKVAQNALDVVTASGRRILKSNKSGGWVVTSNEKNIQKIMDDLRHSKRP
jgi:hypothetical protein